MKRLITGFVIASTLPFAAANAQDFGGMASDSLSSAGSFAGTVGVNSHVKRKPSRSVSPARQRMACAALPRFAAARGANDPQVRQLGTLCRQRGFIR